MRQKEVLSKIFRRTLLIFLVGYLMYWFPFFDFSNGHISLLPFSETRVWGVLQRIAVTYCLASLLVYYFKQKQVIVISALILIAYWVALHLGGDLSLQGNAVYKLDRYLLGDDHLYHGEGVAFDPEGLLSTFPAVVNVVIGFYVGKYLQVEPKNPRRLLTIAVLGFLLIAAAFMWNYVFPISKKLWTSPFTLLTTGLDALIIVTIIYFVDLKKYFGKCTNFFIIPGNNPLAVYLFSELFIVVLSMIRMPGNIGFYEWIFQHFFILFTPYIGSFLQAIAYMLLCWSLAYWLYRKKIYIRL